MKVTVNKQPKSVFELNVAVPNDKVKETYNVLLDKLVKSTEIKGFRKGQAPKSMVEEKSDVSKLYGEVINSLLQKNYPQALKENHISPIANPRVEIKEFDIEKDFEFVATVATRPQIETGDYVGEAKKIYKTKKEALKKINEDKLKKGETLEHNDAQLTADDVVTAIIKTSKVDLPDMLIEEEVNRMMSRLLDQAQSVGLSLENYLKTHNKTPESLKEDYKKVAQDNLIAEFALGEIISQQKLDVEDAEIDTMIKASGTQETQDKLNNPMDKLYIKSILLKNKLISNIIKEIEGDRGKSSETTDKGKKNNKASNKKVKSQKKGEKKMNSDIVVPVVIEKDPRGYERSYDIYSRLLKDFIIFVTGPIDMAGANTFIAQMLFLESENSDRDIKIYINSEGGVTYAGKAMYDTIRHVKNDVATINVGLAASAAALLLSAGTKGKRYSLPHAKAMIHQTRNMGGITGTASEFEIHAQEMKKSKETYAQIIAKNTGQDYEKVLNDIEVDTWFDAKESKKYGIIDDILKPSK